MRCVIYAASTLAQPGIDPETRLVAKFDSGYPDLGQYVIETPEVGKWTHVAIRISDLLANPLDGSNGIDLGNIANLIVIETTRSSTARIRLDNISLSCAVNEFSKAWQWDETCSIEPVLATN